MRSLLRVRAVAPAAGLLALALGLSSAFAQSTGNPKGTPPPPSSDGGKQGVGGRPPSADRGGDSGALRPDQGPAEARLGTSRSPGTGTAGGLPKRTPADGADASRSQASPSGNPTRHPVAPAKN